MTHRLGRALVAVAVAGIAVVIRLGLGASIGPAPWFVVSFIAILMATWLRGPAIGLAAVSVTVLGQSVVPWPGSLDSTMVEARLGFELLNGLLAMLIGLVLRRSGSLHRRSTARAVWATQEAAGAGARLAVLQAAIDELVRTSSALQASERLAWHAVALIGSATARVLVRPPGTTELIRLAESTTEPASGGATATSPQPPASGIDEEDVVAIVIRSGLPAMAGSVAGVPLVTPDGTVGVIEVVGSDLENAALDGRLAALATLGRLGGSAFERLRLRDERREASGAADRSGERLDRMEHLATALAMAVTVEGVGEAIVEQTTVALRAPVGLFYVATVAGDLELVHDRGYPLGLVGRDARIPAPATVPAADALRHGQVVAVESAAAWQKRYPGASDVLTMTGTRSVIAVPIVGSTGPVAVLVLHGTAEGRPADEDLGYLLVAAQQAVAALERARLYAEEREARRLQEAFIGVVSHELRTPITTILAGSKLLTRDRGMTQLGRELAADIEAESDRLFRLVEDLLILNRLERGSLAVDEEPVHVTRILERVVASEASRWPGTRFELPRTRVVHLARGEETYVEQVVRNLLTNAAKYGPAGGRVRIELAHEPGAVVVRILDEGPGIKSDEASQLFDLYYRSPSTSATAAGAGIGLYVCRRLVGAMGGRIWGHRRPTGGSEFGFMLEEYPSEDDAAAPDDTRVRSTPGPTQAAAATPAQPAGGAESVVSRGGPGRDGRMGPE